MKSFLLIISLSILFNIQTNAQRTKQRDGRGQESARIDRIDRKQDRERPTNNPQRKIRKEDKIPDVETPRRQPKRIGGIAICGETEPYCPEKTPICGDRVDISYHYLSNEDLAFQYFESGDLGKALSHVELAIKSDLFNSSLYFLRGKIFFELNDYIQAKRDFTTVIVFEPEFAEPYYYRGMCNLYLGDQNLAMEDFEIAASLGDVVAENLLVRYIH
jgi:tetratricopeptide (TPR) repeat protein